MIFQFTELCHFVEPIYCEFTVFEKRFSICLMNDFLLIFRAVKPSGKVIYGNEGNGKQTILSGIGTH